MIAPAAKKGTRRSGGRILAQQIRVRLRPLERQKLEFVQLQNFKAGRPHAATLSSWVRYQIQPLLGGSASEQPCQISKELYQKVEELARLLNKTPETVIEECVTGIEHLIRHTNVQRPLIVAEWRLRQQYKQFHGED